MAISHLCLHCGIDLAHIRPRREPHYGLSIIRCPDCQTVSVRRRHPLWRFWSTLRRLDWALTVLVANACALTALLIAMVTGVIWFVSLSSTSLPGPDWSESDWIQAGLLLIALPMLIGTWLTAGLSHWRRAPAWLAFFGLAVLGLTAVFGVELIVASSGQRQPGWTRSSTAEVITHQLVLSVALAYLLMIVAIPGILPGRSLLWLLRRARSALWRARRRWQRRMRTG